MSEVELVTSLLAAPAPRPEALARALARRLFPTWQAVLVGVPLALIAASLTTTVAALAVALPLGALVGTPPPAWVKAVNVGAGLLGAAGGVALVARWLWRRRAGFAALARDGVVVAAGTTDATGLARALGTGLGGSVARLALGGAVGGVLQQAYGGPIAVAEHGGEVIEARTIADARGRFRVPEAMLVHPTARYVALLHRAGWVSAQRILRRRSADAAGVPGPA